MYVLLILIIVDILGLFSVLKRNDLDPMYKIVFTLCIILLPIVGIIIYYLFSSRRKRKKFDISKRWGRSSKR
ncbi:PLD nuclease N-terminal domain-containing protein [Butyricimonas faecalis]|uniref:PLDc_N domain-containing protein n=1 Tax=Butyricimonas faecalis TaxID=2093856 RepID=A0A3S9VT25_9BACT|nr:PLDc_N domain-containing protein [Butyricimonas faecalis]